MTVTDEMVDAAAKAMCLARKPNHPSIADNELWWDTFGSKDEYRRLARAALAATRQAGDILPYEQLRWRSDPPPPRPPNAQVSTPTPPTSLHATINNPVNEWGCVAYFDSGADRDAFMEFVGNMPIPPADAQVGTELLMALKDVVADVLDYERVNNLSPAPGRKYCWASVAQAVGVIERAEAAIPPAEAQVKTPLSDYTNAEISTESHRRAQEFLGDPRIGVSGPIPPEKE